MTGPFIRLGVARCALAFLLLIGFMPAAEAAFTFSINGTSFTDNGPGDTNPAVGFISGITTVSGYQIEFSSSTDSSHPTADLTTSQLRIINTASAGTITGALVVTVSESFNVPPGYLGSQDLLNTLTRNIVAGRGTSGVVSSTTAGTSQSGGGSGTTGAVTLTHLVDSGLSTGSFNRTSDFYLLTQTITIDSLRGADGVTITASSFSGSRGSLNVVPAPPALGLLAGGLLTLGLYRVRFRRQSNVT